jgi:hypothetical protein
VAGLLRQYSRRGARYCKRSSKYSMRVGTASRWMVEWSDRAQEVSVPRHYGTRGRHRNPGDVVDVSTICCIKAPCRCCGKGWSCSPVPCSFAGLAYPTHRATYTWVPKEWLKVDILPKVARRSAYWTMYYLGKWWSSMSMASLPYSIGAILASWTTFGTHLYNSS